MPQQDRTSHFSGDLHRLNKTISTAIGFFGLLLLAIIAYAGWSANQTATERERTLAVVNLCGIEQRHVEYALTALPTRVRLIAGARARGSTQNLTGCKVTRCERMPASQ